MIYFANPDFAFVGNFVWFEYVLAKYTPTYFIYFFSQNISTIGFSFQLLYAIMRSRTVQWFQHLLLSSNLSLSKVILKIILIAKLTSY